MTNMTNFDEVKKTIDENITLLRTAYFKRDNKGFLKALEIERQNWKKIFSYGEDDLK